MGARIYGWRPDRPDHRDMRYESPYRAKLPWSYSLRDQMPKVLDQGDIGSCTANAAATAFRVALRRSGRSEYDPSRLFIYWNERYLENMVDFDSGASIRDSVKSLTKFGACDEEMWPYEVPTMFDRPTEACFDFAVRNRISLYQRVNQNVTQVKRAIASGLPVMFGCTVYDGFESDSVTMNGIVNMPAPGEKDIGGHAMLLVGYDDSSGRFTVRNSWGEKWGDNGYCTMPYQYIGDRTLASDFWVVSGL